MNIDWMTDKNEKVENKWILVEKFSASVGDYLMFMSWDSLLLLFENAAFLR